METSVIKLWLAVLLFGCAPGGAETVDVTSFGAAGDGVTDDRAALQLALDTSETVYLPAAVYRLSGPLRITKPVVLFGEGELRVDVSSAVLELDNVDGVTIDGIQLRNPATYEEIAAYGRAVGNKHNLIRDLSTTGAHNVEVRGVTLRGGFSGVRIKSVSSRWRIVECDFAAQVFCGVMTGASNVEIAACRFADIGTDTPDDSFFPGGHGHHTHSIYVNALADEVVSNYDIAANEFVGTTGSAVYVGTGAERAIIRGVRLWGNVFARNATYGHYAPTQLFEHVAIGTTLAARCESAVYAQVDGNTFDGSVASMRLFGRCFVRLEDAQE